MKKILSIILLIMFVIPIAVIAQSDDTSADQLSYNQQKWALLKEVYSNPDYVSLIDIKKATITLEDLSRSFKKIEEEYDQYNEERGLIEEKYGNVQQSINMILNDSNRTKELVIDTLTKISLLKNKIARLKDWIEAMTYSIFILFISTQPYSTMLTHPNSSGASPVWMSCSFS